MEESETKEKKDNKGSGALFIPAGLLLGFGIGFLYNNIPAGMFIGLGVGFTLFAIIAVYFSVKK